MLNSGEEEFVDLGLSVLWAKGNLIKDSNGNYSIGEETDWGTYVSWGNIDGHNYGEGYSFDEETYKWYTSGGSASADISSNDSTRDICFARLGAPWHLPTKADFQELYNNTDMEWPTINGVVGCKFMKKTDHSIYVFFPISGLCDGTSRYSLEDYGLYWSSSRYSGTYAYNLYLHNYAGGAVNPQYTYRRYIGLPVRPVMDK